ncbi:hypothetical protein [Streptomyces viridochromogenes]|uniref:hypothetical protein n=1 Tax=Streptomyces viridochromogenes TaxID=1938 RepID=UPI000AD075C3|nr:hypothetical protein [Streptomyces viridochromogenes]
MAKEAYEPEGPADLELGTRHARAAALLIPWSGPVRTTAPYGFSPDGGGAPDQAACPAV